MTPEQRARIRQLFFAEHWKIGTIAKELGLHRDTVKRALETERMGPSKVVRASMLDPYKPFFEEILQKHPRLRATRIYQMIKSRGYPGSEIQVRRYVRQIRPKKIEPYFKRETLPGEEAQVDWGSFGKFTIGNARRPLSCFVMVLGHSRALYARFSLNQTMESFLKGHVEAFHAFGGVPRTILYDNLKSAVLEREGQHVRYHPTLLELAGYYHFRPKACAVARGNEKGKVERAIQYIRHAFFEATSFQSIAELNQKMSAWIQNTTMKRNHPVDPQKRQVEEVFSDEQNALLPLPKHEFACTSVKPISTQKTPYVRFDQNDYSVPHEYTQTQLTLLANEDEIEIQNDLGQVVARHARSYNARQVIEDEVHLQGLRDYKKRARQLAGRERLFSLCPSSKLILENLQTRGETIRPQTAHLNRLVDVYGPETVETAIQKAVERNVYTASAVGHILDMGRRKKGLPPKLVQKIPDNPKLKGITVRPHDLKTYDALIGDQDGND